MFWFLVILFLSLTYANLSDASHNENKLPSAVVVGTVYCDTCFQHDFSIKSHFISGASVAVECNDGNLIKKFKKEVKTNEYGEFKVQLPFKVRKHVKKIKGCTFKLISSSEPHCGVASISTSSSMSLKTRNKEQHTFSAGLFSFKPIKKPNLCNQKESVSRIPLSSSLITSKSRVLKSNSDKSQPNKNIADTFYFPPIPFLSSPLIRNPFFPSPLFPYPFHPSPLIPNPFNPPSTPSLFPPLIPNPFQQPPSTPSLFPPLIPNPFQPPPSSPSVFPPLIPNPFQPPPSPPSLPHKSQEVIQNQPRQ